MKRMTHPEINETGTSSSSEKYFVASERSATFAITPSKIGRRIMVDIQ
jgi:hypothetical protein